MLNNEGYSAFPTEDKFLLTEGIRVWVLSIVKVHKVVNNYEQLAKYNGKTIMIVHMMHDCGLSQ